MKNWKLAIKSLIVGCVLSSLSITAYAACSSTIYVQDDSDCHMYHRYVLVGSDSNGEVEVCAYEDSGGSLHREDTCDGGFILQ